MWYQQLIFFVIQGHRGAMGNLGPEGQQGQKGEPGPIGPPGEKGDKGQDVSCSLLIFFSLFTSHNNCAHLHEICCPGWLVLNKWEDIEVAVTDRCAKRKPPNKMKLKKKDNSFTIHVCIIPCVCMSIIISIK